MAIDSILPTTSNNNLTPSAAVPSNALLPIATTPAAGPIIVPQQTMAPAPVIPSINNDIPPLRPIVTTNAPSASVPAPAVLPTKIDVSKELSAQAAAAAASAAATAAATASTAAAPVVAAAPQLPVQSASTLDMPAGSITTIPIIHQAATPKSQPLSTISFAASGTVQASGTISQPNITQKVKFVQGNQFVKLQPPPMNTQKIYMKTTPKSVVNPQQPITFRVAPTVGTGFSADGKSPIGGNKLIQIKGKGVGVGTQILTTTNMVQSPARLANVQQAAATVGGVSGVTSRPSTPKFAIIKSTGNQPLPTTPIHIQNPTQMQIAKLQTTSAATSAAPTSGIVTETNTLNNTNILDIPILFADNEGNITNEHVQQQQTPTVVGQSIDHQPSSKETVVLATSTATPVSAGNYIVIASQPNSVVQNRPIVVSGLAPITATATSAAVTHPGKFVVINRGNLKTTTTIANHRPIKYTKMLLPPSGDTNVAKVATATISTKASPRVTSQKTLTPGTKIDISSLVKSGAMSSAKASTIVTGHGSNKPIIINSDKGAFKNMIKIPSTSATVTTSTAFGVTTVPASNIVRTMSTPVSGMPIIKSGILNRSITVRKINIIRQPNIAGATTITSLPVATQSNASPTTTTNANKKT